jgi:short-subunit dehydrogenase
LGRAAALHLAEKYRAKPLLVGRRLSKLEALQDEIRDRFDVSCETVVADQSTANGRELIATRVAELEATAALFAAGITSVGLFDADCMADYNEVIDTNILGFTDLLARIVTVFKSRNCRSSILPVSSLAAETSVPYQAVYGASKAYVNTLIQAVSTELAGTSISVGAFVPGGIDTDMAVLSDLQWGKLGLMNVDRCAALAVSAMVEQRSFTVPGVSNRLTYLASRALPRSLVSRLAGLPYRRPR